MSWKCLFFHDYKEIDRQSSEIYGEERDLPVAHETYFLLKCDRCYVMKTICLMGFWKRKNDDDDNDDDPESKTPLTPDDYYDSMNGNLK